MSSSQAVIPARSMLTRAWRIVPYLTPEEVYKIADSCSGSKAERNRLLILTLFETGLRISEALNITPRKIGIQNGHGVLYITGKGNKPRMVACPDSLAHQLKSYAYTQKLSLDDRIFKFNRKVAWYIVKRAGEKSGVGKRIWPHLFRHSDAIERLKQTGNPKALQLHLGHSTLLMTMRYLSTLLEEDAVRIEQGVRFDR